MIAVNRRRSQHILLSLVGLALSANCPADDPLERPFPATFELTEIDAETGFLIRGEPMQYVGLGSSVSSAGDIDGDGVDDLVIGGWLRTTPDLSRGGAAYVILGKDPLIDPPFPQVIGVEDLTGLDGFRILGSLERGYLGISVSSAGDINADGQDDIIMSAPLVDVPGDPRFREGVAYVLYGREVSVGMPFPAVIQATSIGGADGFVAERPEMSGGLSSSLTHIGDLNGDGLSDVVIADGYAYHAALFNHGSAYVVYGRAGSGAAAFPAMFPILDLPPDEGFRIDGTMDFRFAGNSVSGAGDFNHDGHDDLVVSHSRGVFVLFGRDAAAAGLYPSVLPVSTEGDDIGIQITSSDLTDLLGRAVSYAGDVNGDGIDDIIVGADRADPEGRQSAGSSYVIFGRDTVLSGAFPSPLNVDELDGTSGFRIDGAEAYDYSGASVSAAGDLNGDGLDDVVVAAWYNSSMYRDPGAGHAYVIYGRDTTQGVPFPARVSLAELDGSNGFLIDNEQGPGRAGMQISAAGDMNHDGRDDLVVCFPNAGTGGFIQRGECYVIYGRSVPICAPDVDGDGQLTIFDFLTFQNLFQDGSLLVDFDGDGDLTIFDFLAFQNAFDDGCP